MMEKKTSPQAENGHTDIANELMDALARTRISGEARQVLDFILRKTYGWHKKEDRISLSQFVDGTTLKKPTICKAINKLKRMKLIITQKDNAGNVYYCFNKHYNKWSPLPKKVTLPKKVKGVTQKGNKSLPKKVHTKETYTKETYTKEKKILKEKVQYLDFVYFTDEEYAKLLKKFGRDILDDKITRMNSYAHQIGEVKFKAKYKSHYHTLLNWESMSKNKEGESDVDKAIKQIYNLDLGKEDGLDLSMEVKRKGE